MTPEELIRNAIDQLPKLTQTLPVLKVFFDGEGYTGLSTPDDYVLEVLFGYCWVDDLEHLMAISRDYEILVQVLETFKKERA